MAARRRRHRIVLIEKWSMPIAVDYWLSRLGEIVLREWRVVNDAVGMATPAASPNQNRGSRCQTDIICSAAMPGFKESSSVL